MAAKNKTNELKIIRVYDAPVKLVWEAWTDPKQAAKWWGPRGFTITTHSKDLKVGGSWHYTMHGPDGTNYENKTIYFEVEKYSKLVYDHGGNDDRPPLFRVTVQFSEVSGKTKMDMTMTLATPEAAEEIKKHIKQANGNSTWDRLAEFLSKETSNKEHFVINRTFDAPIETLFEMWTDPKHFPKWMGPAEATMKIFRAEIKTGGNSFYTMFGPNDYKLFGKTHYLKIEKPNLIIYTQQFCDENEKTIRHPMAPIWPETMLTIVNFSAEDDNKTRVTLTWEPYGSATTEEIETFVKARSGMNQGWTGSFDKLEEYLTQR